MFIRQGKMNGFTKGLLWLIIVVVCLAVVPLAANAGLLILGIDPNPRHPPMDLLGEAVGWGIIGLLAGAVSTIIGESVTMPLGSGNPFADNKGLIVGAAIGLTIALFFGTNLAVLQMDSVDGQAITSVNLGLIAGATVSILAGIAGVILGVVLRRALLALA